ncbi:MAG: hypothetical protein P3W87_004090 [Gammaproteobacteria bacterium]|nr:hypothetical protein [Gammaproteobacteria bacterium]
MLQKLYQMAVAGDVQAAKLLLDRALPPLQAVRDAVFIDGDTPAAMKADLLAKVAGGEIAPREALAMLEVLAHMPGNASKERRAIDAQVLHQVRTKLYGEENTSGQS